MGRYCEICGERENFGEIKHDTEAHRQHESELLESRLDSIEGKLEQILEAVSLPVVIHMLAGGATLCRFEEGKPPSEWPEHHRWVSALERNKVNCQGCVRNM